MSKHATGQTVKVPCMVQQGAFSGESLVTITIDGREMSGFVRSDLVVDVVGDRGYILGRVLEADEKANTVTVSLPGSFFTTAAGRTLFPKRWASENLIPAAA